MSTEPVQALRSGEDFSFVLVDMTTLKLGDLPYEIEAKEFLSVTVKRDLPSHLYFCGPTPPVRYTPVMAMYTPESHTFNYDPCSHTLRITGAEFYRGDLITVLLQRRPLPGAARAINHKRINDELRQRSGAVTSKSRLVCFLYHLLRDHLPAADVEELARTATEYEEESLYSNGWLAHYAEDVAKRLQGEDVRPNDHK
jgi:hypothetical protein